MISSRMEVSKDSKQTGGLLPASQGCFPDMPTTHAHAHMQAGTRTHTSHKVQPWQGEEGVHSASRSNPYVLLGSQAAHVEGEEEQTGNQQPRVGKAGIFQGKVLALE